MCPPDVDQTCRSQQLWQILAPRLRQGQKLAARSEYYTSNPEDFLFNQDHTWDAWSKLAKPVDFDLFRQTVSYTKRGSGAKTSTSSLSSLECMPAELLQMIFDDETLEKQDITALGLCSQTLWQHMLERVESAYRKNAAPWADSEIACTGTYLVDLPESFDKDNMALDSVTRKGGLASMTMARRFNWAAWAEYKQPKESQQDEWRSALRAHRIAAAIPGSCWVKLEEDVSCGKLFPNLTSKGRGWVLRNHATKEYVRICASSKFKEEYVVNASSARWLRLDDVLIMRICWTTRFSYEEREDIKKGLYLYRGKWAGHRFDIVMQEDSLAKTDGWKNITAEIVSEAQKLRRSILSSRGQKGLRK
jgi:hypothetical protein